METLKNYLKNLTIVIIIDVIGIITGLLCIIFSIGCLINIKQDAIEASLVLFFIGLICLIGSLIYFIPSVKMKQMIYKSRYSKIIQDKFLCFMAKPILIHDYMNIVSTRPDIIGVKLYTKNERNKVLTYYYFFDNPITYKQRNKFSPLLFTGIVYCNLYEDTKLINSLHIE